MPEFSLTFDVLVDAKDYDEAYELQERIKEFLEKMPIVNYVSGFAVEELEEDE